MIPEFPNFKPLELGDHQDVQAFTSRYLPYSDFNFVSLWSWNLSEKIAISQIFGNLVVRFTDYLTDESFFSFIGDNEPDTTCERLLEFSLECNVSPCLRLLPEVSVRAIDTTKFELIETREHFDYVYALEDLREYRGTKYAKKRNHVNRFLQDFPHVTAKQVSLNEDTYIRSVLDLAHKWQDDKREKGQGLESHDVVALQRLLKGVELFDLVTVGVFIDETLVAFFVNELIDSEHVLAHIMKADTSIAAGVYAYLVKENARILSSLNVKYFNFEQDLGLENLRIAKSRFHPQFFLKKYALSYKGAR